MYIVQRHFRTRASILEHLSGPEFHANRERDVFSTQTEQNSKGHPGNVLRTWNVLWTCLGYPLKFCAVWEEEKIAASEIFEKADSAASKFITDLRARSFVRSFYLPPCSISSGREIETRRNRYRFDESGFLYGERAKIILTSLPFAIAKHLA